MSVLGVTLMDICAMLSEADVDDIRDPSHEILGTDLDGRRLCLIVTIQNENILIENIKDLTAGGKP